MRPERILLAFFSILALTLAACHTTASSPHPTPTPTPTPPGCVSPTPPPSSQTVTSSADSGPGSLRATLAASQSGGYVTFASTLTGATIALASQLVIPNNVTILAPCPNVSLTGSTTLPLVYVSGASLATINNLSITNTAGTALGVGAGSLVTANGLVLSNSSAPSCAAVSMEPGSTTLSLSSSRVSKNTSAGDGIICLNGGELDLDKDAISANTTSGAAAVDIANGKSIISNSEFDNNHSGQTGGAITQANGTMGITNSTFYANASSKGAAIYVAAPAIATLDNITAVANTAPQIANLGSMLLHNNLIANAPGVDVSGSISSAGYNFISNPGTSTGWLSSDLLNKSIGLYPFGYYGGPTDTIPPDGGSAAVNGGDPADNTCPATDQRGLARPIDGRCDIGAVEYNFASPP